MIVEKFPELADLDGDQKLILAGELWRSVTKTDDSSPEISREAAEMLEERLNHLEANPETGIRWEDLRDLKRHG
ncbi:MAG: addiction module protein [Verrucomicrobiota bacterium]